MNNEDLKKDNEKLRNLLLLAIDLIATSSDEHGLEYQKKYENFRRKILEYNGESDDE